MRARRIAVVAVGLLGVISGAASVGWACTVQPRILAPTPSSAPERSTVNVKGEGLTVDGGPVELRWNAVEGRTIATATTTGGRFSTEVTIPEAAPGVYTIVAVSQGEGVARVSFEVTPSVASGLDSATTANAASREVWPALRSTPARVESPAPSATGRSLALGVGLLGFGLVALFSGSVIAVVRRRRLPITSGSHRSYRTHWRR